MTPAGPRSRRRILWKGTGLIAVLTAATLFSAHRVEAQGESNELRVGVTLGSTAFLGLSLEYIWDQTGVELNLGTWALRDISVAVSGKQYIGQGTVRGFVGVGIWNVTAWQEEGLGSGLILRAPVGFEVEALDNTAIGAELNVSKALWIKRADPEDDTPPQDRIVPLPGFYAKWTSHR